MAENIENTIIKTIGESGEEIYMKLVEVVQVAGLDYALLSIVEEDSLPSGDTDDDEIVIMRMIKKDDEVSFEIIEDDEEFNMVASAINEADEIEEEMQN